ncbi:DUF3006 domain-containing protein [Natronocalculus amylovorans]|uniref:DUF3006 domain-containing protein n=1 Tax=Natronocalculus amylovorans TaxID=2917812 RepID=A0AAE3FV45_9EURY|nr:DUF3006 domain-containing protein [Natronocalculus amylovorans]MCL9815715.1 DUF3006 domain-containing protein [Natronocalculus amylovorans]NUE01773.1 DUF3006 domain-containing protein [Halorubraceae archaeon YAN]
MTTHVYTGVVDRIVDDTTAVILLERNGTTIEQLDVPKETLPTDGQHEGAVFEITVRFAIESMEYLPETEVDRKQAAQDRLDGLSKRLGESDDDAESTESQ